MEIYKKIIINMQINFLCFIFKKRPLNPNRAGLFEGSFSWGEGGGVQFDPPSYFKKNLSNINITLYHC